MTLWPPVTRQSLSSHLAPSRASEQTTVPLRVLLENGINHQRGIPAGSTNPSSMVTWFMMMQLVILTWSPMTQCLPITERLIPERSPTEDPSAIRLSAPTYENQSVRSDLQEQTRLTVDFEGICTEGATRGSSNTPTLASSLAICQQKDLGQRSAQVSKFHLVSFETHLLLKKSYCEISKLIAPPHPLMNDAGVSGCYDIINPINWLATVIIWFIFW